MSLVVNTTKIRIPREKGKVNGKTVSKGKYVEYHLREWLRHNLGVINEIELDRLAKTITNLLVRIVGSDNVAMLSISFRYSGVIRVSDMEKSYYNFDLSVYVNGKLIHVYQFIANRPEVYVDNSVDSDSYVDFAFIADFVRNHNSVVPAFDMPNDFANIANYVVDFVEKYHREKPRRVSDYHVITNFAKFIELLDMFHIAFLSQETTKLISTKFAYLAYRYLRDSGYFAYVSAINHGIYE